MGRPYLAFIGVALALAAVGGLGFLFLGESAMEPGDDQASLADAPNPGPAGGGTAERRAPTSGNTPPESEGGEAIEGAQDATAVLVAEGRVISGQGDPIPHAVVLGEQLVGRRPLHAKVDAEGRFALRGKALGLRSLRVVAKGFGARRMGSLPLGNSVVVVLNQAAEFRGIVTRAAAAPGEKPTPLRKASVILRPAHTATNEELKSTTDNLGRFTFAALPPGRWNASVSAEGSAPIQDNRIEFQPGQVFERNYELGAGITLSGFAATSGGKTRLRNVRIEALTQWAPTVEASHRRRLGPVVTNDEGKFTLRGLEPGPVLLLARGRGYASWFKEIQITPGIAPVSINLPPRIEIAGRVLDPAGKPRSGMRVSIKPKAIALHQFTEIAPFLFGLENWSDAMGPRPGFVTTNSEGRFKIDSAPPVGACEITAQDPQERLAPSETKVLALNQTLPKSIELRLRSGTKVSGTIANEDGLPVEGAQILLAGLRTVSDAQGSFALRGVPQGQQTAAVRHQAYSNWRMPVTVPREGLQGVGVTLKRGRRIYGRVIDLQGHPVIGAWAVLSDTTRTPSIKVATARSDTSGRFQFGGLMQDKLRLLVDAPGCESFILADVIPAVDFQELTVSVKPAALTGVGDITGRVIDDETGEAILNYELPIHKGFDVARSGESFVIRNAVAGENFIQVKASGYQSLVVGPRELAPDSVLDLGTLRLGKSFRFTVHVSDPQGKPAQGVRAHLEDLGVGSRNNPSALRASVSPRAPHFFSWPELRKGRYKFVFYGDNWQTLEHTVGLSEGGHVQLKLSPKR